MDMTHPAQPPPPPPPQGQAPRSSYLEKENKTFPGSKFNLFRDDPSPGVRGLLGVCSVPSAGSWGPGEGQRGAALGIGGLLSAPHPHRSEVPVAALESRAQAPEPW